MGHQKITGNLLSFTCLLALLTTLHCGGDDDDSSAAAGSASGATAGAGGTGANAGTSGSGGESGGGTGGSSGSAGTGAVAGSGGTAGTGAIGGSGGNAGTGNAGTGGMGATAGIGGSGGSGNAGSGGTQMGGSAGTGGSVGGTGGSGGSAGTISADMACTEQAVATCAKREECRFADASRTYGSIATCEERTKMACLYTLAASDTANTAEHVAACAQATVSATCDQWRSVEPLAECAAEVGPYADGDSCLYNAQCQSRYCEIKRDLGEACGVCAPTPTEGSSCAEGQGCGPTSLDCANNGLCQTPGIEGDACNGPNPCGIGLSCVGAGGGMMGTCQISPDTIGAACEDTTDTLPDCDRSEGLFCTTGGVCEQAGVVTEGQACGKVNNTLVLCGGGTVCLRPNPNQPGICVVPPKENEPCSLDGADCLLPARCLVASGQVDGMCVLPENNVCISP